MEARAAVGCGEGLEEQARRSGVLLARAGPEDPILGGRERQFPGDQLVEDYSRRVQVAAGTDGEPQRLLGRHVMGRPEDLPRRGELRRGRHHEPGDPEVREKRPVGLGQQDVPRLQVAVHEAVGVRMPPWSNRMTSWTARPPGRHRLGRTVRERLAVLDVPQHDVAGATGRAEVVDRQDVGVLQPRDHLCLALEPGREPGSQKAESTLIATTRANDGW